MDFLFLGSLLLIIGCGGPTDEKSITEESDEIETANDILWNIKAIHPEGQTLDIKAFDKEGNAFDVKAIQNSDQDSFLDVRSIVDGKRIPVKMLVSGDPFAPVRAIAEGGATYEVHAITPEGEKLDVKGVARIGSIVIMRCISQDGEFYGVKAISPEGKLNDIKGIKINNQEREMSLQGKPIFAHIKAMHPVENEENFKVPTQPQKGKKPDFKRVNWNIKAVTPEGKNLDIKAFDPEGYKFDVKATQDSEQHSFMSIRAFAEGYELPVRIMAGSDEYAPVKAVGSDGTIYDIKAITESGEKLDIKGTGRSGRIIHVKAVTENGELYGVKAFSPDGKLNDVKGIKIFDRKVELVSQGNEVYAHLKAISQ